MDRRAHGILLASASVAAPAHMVLAPLFLYLGIPFLAWFNVGSSILWILVIVLVKSGSIRNLYVAYYLGGLEIVGHAVASVLLVGWGLGFQYYIINQIVVTYFAPHNRLKLGKWFLAPVSGIIFMLLYYVSRDQSAPAGFGLLIDVINVSNMIVSFSVLSLQAHLYRKMAESAENRLATEHERSESLLRNILPEEIADRLKGQDKNPADGFAEATVLFADIVGFTPLSARLKPEELVSLLNRLFSRFDDLVDEAGLEKIKTIGDAYMVASGLPTPRTDHAAAIARLALAMNQAMKEFSAETGENLELRIGINSGPVIAGVIGKRKFIYDLWGDTVNVAARMESQGIEGQIQISESTAALLGEEFEVQSRGNIEVKGRGSMSVCLLRGFRMVG